MTNELKPCPFCGCTATLWGEVCAFWVECSNCLADQKVSDTREKAITAWNNRAEVIK